MAELNSPGSLQVGITNRQILSIALPISMAMLIPQLNFITNNIFISGIGETELGTAGITGVFYLVFALIGNGLNSGVQGLIARRAGENRPQEIGKLFAQSIWLVLLYAAAGIILIYAIASFFLSSVLSIQKVQEEATEFMKIRIWGVPFLYTFQACNALLVGTNNSRYMKYGFIIMAVMNILLDYTFIYGHWGLPRLGFNGAAWASVIAEFIGMIVVLSIIFYKKFNRQFSLFTHMRINKELLGLIFRQTSPLILQWLLSIIGWLLFYILIEHTGERPLAISNAMRNIFGFFGIFVWAFASTTNAMVSNIIGQGKKDKVFYLITRIMRLSLLFTGILCLLINIFPGLFLSLYGRDESFVTAAIPVIRIVSLGTVLMSMATVWLNAVTGTGNTRMNLAIEIVAIAIYSIYIWMVLKVWHLSLAWAWCSEILYWLLIFSLAFFYIRSGKWKSKNI
jgi:MATE family, multidrug efflux pump